MEEKAKKPKKPLFDDVHGLTFMERWSATSRWISVLPIAIVVFIIVRVFLIDIVLYEMLKSIPLLANCVCALATFLAYFAVVYVSAAAAPEKRYVVALTLAVCISGFLTYTSLMFWYTSSFGLEPFAGMVLTLSMACSVLGSFYGVKSTDVREKRRERKQAYR